MWQTAYEQYRYSLLQVSWMRPYFTEQTTTGQWSKVINSIQAAKWQNWIQISESKE